MSQWTLRLAVLGVSLSSGAFAQQGMPTTQPNVLQIIREDVKVGHDAEHGRLEASWIPVFDRAKFPYYELALAGTTGTPQVWFVMPFETQAAVGDFWKRMGEEPLAADAARLLRADADHVSDTRTILAVARKDLSHGSFPDSGKQRFYEVTTFRVRPGHEGEFAAAGKAYGAAATRATPNAAYRVYEVIAGMPTPTYFIFSSTTTAGDFDKMTTEGEAAMKAFNNEESAAMHKFATDALISAETQRFRLDPEMSYVPKEVRAQDPDFWMPKKPAAKKPTSQH